MCTLGLQFALVATCSQQGFEKDTPLQPGDDRCSNLFVQNRDGRLSDVMAFGE
jgi:hypothetical protein